LTNHEFKQLMRKLDEILYALKPHVFSLEVEQVFGGNMDLSKKVRNIAPVARLSAVGDMGGLTSPGTASILVSLLDNGVPYIPSTVQPPASAYTFNPTLTCDDNSVTMVADPNVVNQANITIPTGDTNTSVTFTATAVAPDGSTATGSLTIPFGSVAQQYSISLVQTS
jgi:hypothetical protein